LGSVLFNGTEEDGAEGPEVATAMLFSLFCIEAKLDFGSILKIFFKGMFIRI
jgi:hypothetical protein